MKLGANYPLRITNPDNGYKGLHFKALAAPRFATAGTVIGGRYKEEKYDEVIAHVHVPTHEADALFLLAISLTSIFPMGGDFDESDFVFADIYSIGVDPETGDEIHPDEPRGFGGFVNLPWVAASDARPGFGGVTGISTYIGKIKGDVVKFRLGCNGDNLASASYVVVELGMEA